MEHYHLFKNFKWGNKMGSDNLFHKRKARSIKSSRRKLSIRAPYKRILIVCEGEKTEPNYFRGLVSYYKLNTAYIEITGECGSEPKSIVNFAKQKSREEKNQNNPFDEVYCVFDKDSHSNYKEAISDIEAVRDKETKFIAITSVPCFEYWLLLHFIYTTKPYLKSSSSSSSSTEVIKELKNYIQDYQKNHSNIFEQLRQNLDFAINNAKKVLENLKGTECDNPSTHVHILVENLIGLKNASAID